MCTISADRAEATGSAPSRAVASLQGRWRRHDFGSVSAKRARATPTATSAPRPASQTCQRRGRRHCAGSASAQGPAESATARCGSAGSGHGRWRRNNLGTARAQRSNLASAGAASSLHRGRRRHDSGASSQRSHTRAVSGAGARALKRRRRRNNFGGSSREPCADSAQNTAAALHRGWGRNDLRTNPAERTATAGTAHDSRALNCRRRRNNSNPRSGDRTGTTGVFDRWWWRHNTRRTRCQRSWTRS